MSECNIIPARVIYSIAVPSPITPAEPLPPLPDIPRGSLVIVEGRAPVVGHGPAPPARLAGCCPGSRSAPGAASHSREWQVGQVLDVTLSVSGDSISRLK
jgi:CRISPR-associated protein Csx3